MSLVNIKIEGKPFQVEAGLTVLEACRKCGFVIPSLCSFNHGKNSLASCRVCLVEIKGARGLSASCVYPVSEGMEISISSQTAMEARRASVELILSNHEKNCLQCPKNGHCELLHVAEIVQARDQKYIGEFSKTTVDEIAPGSFVTPRNAFFVGVALKDVRKPKEFLFSDLKIVDSKQLLPQSKTAALLSPHVCNAGNVFLFAQLVL